MNVISITIFGDKEKAVIVKGNDELNDFETNHIDFTEQDLVLTIKAEHISDAIGISKNSYDDLYINLANPSLNSSQKAYINNHKNYFIVIIDIEALRQDTLMSRTYAKEYRLDYSKNTSNSRSINEQKIKLSLNNNNGQKELNVSMKLNKILTIEEKQEEVNPNNEKSEDNTELEIGELIEG